MVEAARVFDRKALDAARRRASLRFSDHDFLFEWARRQLLERLSEIRRDFPVGAQIGGRGTLLRPDMRAVAFSGEEEFLDLKPASLDMAASILDLHSVNDLPGALLQIRRALKPDGLFIAAMFGGETLPELRESLMQAELSLKGGVSPRVFPFADKQQLGGLLQRAGFTLPVVDSETLTVTYADLPALMHDLRGMGEGNILAARDKRHPGKAFFTEAARYYADRFAEADGRIPARFEVIFLIGWAPHESQPRPLKPGSATHKLADVLGEE